MPLDADLKVRTTRAGDMPMRNRSKHTAHYPPSETVTPPGDTGHTATRDSGLHSSCRDLRAHSSCGDLHSRNPREDYEHCSRATIAHPDGKRCRPGWTLTEDRGP